MTNPTPRLEFRIGFTSHGVEPVAAPEMDYLLDGDDQVVLRAHAFVFILGGGA